jgi:hypothetical protein
MFAYPVEDPERYGVVEFDKAGPGGEPGGETESAEVALCRDGFVLLRSRRGADCRDAEAFGARGARDHGSEPALSRGREAEGGDHEPRHGVAGYGHARFAAGGRCLCTPSSGGRD